MNWNFSFRSTIIPRMYYLERNKRLVAEARGASLSRGQVVGEASRNSGMRFFCAGSFYSEVLGRDIFVGVKEYKNPSSTESFLEGRVTVELAIIAVIAEQANGLRDDLPQLYALLRGENDKPFGILMEDLSEGSKLSVCNLAYIPPMLTTIFGVNVIDPDFAENMSFSVEGRIRYGDFYPLFRTAKRKEALARLPLDVIKKEIARHTVRLGRDI